MAAIHGKDGNVKIGGSAGASITAWTIDFLGPALFDASPLQDTWQTLQDGQRSASGSIVCNFDTSDSNVQEALRADAVGGTTATLQLYVNGTNYFSVPAYITMTSSVQVNNVVTRTYNFRSTGTVSWN